MTEQIDVVRLDFGDAVADLRALPRDDETMDRACERVVLLAEAMGGLLGELRARHKASRRNSRGPILEV